MQSAIRKNTTRVWTRGPKDSNTVLGAKDPNIQVKSRVRAPGQFKKTSDIAKSRRLVKSLERTIVTEGRDERADNKPVNDISVPKQKNRNVLGAAHAGVRKSKGGVTSSTIFGTSYRRIHSDEKNNLKTRSSAKNGPKKAPREYHLKSKQKSRKPNPPEHSLSVAFRGALIAQMSLRI